uniref:Uncharacterized protein n=1 Tax=Myotis myotis TaxID=51298 RepID=A0A7J7VIC3_MYOMY|nr:hypothetical protein mMyoMyo1_008237 [Myotis myotis]
MPPCQALAQAAGWRFHLDVAAPLWPLGPLRPWGCGPDRVPAPSPRPCLGRCALRCGCRSLQLLSLVPFSRNSHCHSPGSPAVTESSSQVSAAEGGGAPSWAAPDQRVPCSSAGSWAGTELARGQAAPCALEKATVYLWTWLWEKQPQDKLPGTGFRGKGLGEGEWRLWLTSRSLLPEKAGLGKAGVSVWARVQHTHTPHTRAPS